jgi:hypothetical protein
MGKYNSFKGRNDALKPKRNEVHPVMRGIGCVLFVLVPILSYGTAVLLVNYGRDKGWPIPPDWFGTPTIHPLLLRLQGLRPIYDFIYAQSNLTANLIFAIAIAVVLFGILSIIYGFMFKLMGPPQYGPTDEPPIRKKVKRYTR